MQRANKIDVHAHYFPPAYEAALARHGLTRLDGAAKPTWSEEGQLEFMERMGIACAALSISSPHLHFGDAAEAAETARASNAYGAALAQRHPGRFVILGSLPLPETEASVQEIRYCREQLGIRGFALPTHALGRYLGDPELEPVMEELDRCPTVAVLHPTQPAAQWEGINQGLPAAVLEYFCDTTRAVTQMLLQGTIRKHPNIHFVVPHAGAFLPVLSDRLSTLAGALGLAPELDVAGDLARLYYDLAGVSMPKQYDLLRTVAEESHLLYGSDAPFTPPALCGKLTEAMDAKLGANRQRVYYDNALALFSKLRYDQEEIEK